MTPEQMRERAERLYDRAAETGNMDLYAEADALTDMADDADSIADQAQWDGTWDEEDHEDEQFHDSYEDFVDLDEEEDIDF